MLRSFAVLTSVSLVLMMAGCGETAADTTGSGGDGGAGAGAGAGGSGGAGGGAGGAGGAATTTTTTPAEITIGGERPVKMYVPDSYDGSAAAPLVVLLHGYGASGSVQEIYFGLKSVAAERGFIYAVPDGTLDATDKRFWNALGACCDFGNTGVDDSAYLSGVVDEIKAAYNIDPKRVYFVGHSNGGFMSYRMACDHADQIAAIVSLAGAAAPEASDCAPSEPVAVAQIHGTADETVLYEGGAFVGVAYPGAVETVERWAALDGCDLTPADGGTLDLESALAGEETKVSVYGAGCAPGGHAELWTIEAGGHIPSLAPDFKQKVFDFLEAHPKP